MSVTFSVVRLVSSQQVNLYMADEDQAWQDLCVDEFEHPLCFSSYELIELVSTGWTGGARTRVKRMAPEKVFIYLNKLLAGGWITGDEYHKVFGSALRLLQKNRAIFPEHIRQALGLSSMDPYCDFE